MNGHKEKLMIMLMGKKKPEPSKNDGEPDEEEGGLDEEGQHAAMSDFIDAVHRKDADGANEALGEWMSHCDAEHEESDNHEE